MHRILTFFCIICVSFCSISLDVFANTDDALAIMGVTKEDFDGWSDEEIANWVHVNWGRLLSSNVGFVPGRDALSVVETQFKLQVDKDLVGQETYEEWVSRNIGIQEKEDGTPQLWISDELSDAMYLACMKYINEYTGWVNLYSYDVGMFYECFKTQAGYNHFKRIVDSRKSNQIAIFKFINARPLLIIFDYDGLYMDSNLFNSPYNVYTSIRSDDSWIPKDYELNKDNGYKSANAEFHVWGFDGLEYTSSWTEDVKLTVFAMHTGLPIYPTIGGSGFTPSYWYVVDDIPREYRVYRTLEDYKEYSVGSRPYFTTDKFQDYDINGDNSCILSDSQLNGSTLYGDVITYIINNYDDADGLTEEELRAILEEYLNGSSGGSGGSSGPSWGWSSLLDGLGGLLDGVLAVIGKLFEYIGKALELFTGTLEKLLKVIPENVTNLLVGLFPFMPEEWSVAIELALVLSIILMVIGFVKK